MNRTRGLPADYAELLPFVRQDDLPKRRIEEFIAVDTQTIQPLRGMSARHGPDNRPSPADARAPAVASGRGAGATTTLLVERLEEHAVRPVPSRLLLLLGITRIPAP